MCVLSQGEGVFPDRIRINCHDQKTQLDGDSVTVVTLQHFLFNLLLLFFFLQMLLSDFISVNRLHLSRWIRIDLFINQLYVCTKEL